MKPVNTDWTPILTSRLRFLFNEGISLSHIASELAMSYNAVIGKCNRLGLVRDPPKADKSKKPNWTRPRHDPSKNKKLNKILAGPPLVSDSLPSTPESDLEIPLAQRKSFFELVPTSCRFIVGDPSSLDHFYCGACKLPLLPYCADHARRCFHPARGS